MVFTDGIPADRENGNGRVMFLNGYVLSFPTNRDVSLEVTVAGTVPEGVSGATVLMVRELDNSGNPVPGSTITVTEPVAEQAPATAATSSPVETISLPSQSPSPPPAPTRAGGIGCPAGLAAACALGLAFSRSGQGKRP